MFANEKLVPTYNSEYNRLARSKIFLIFTNTQLRSHKILANMCGAPKVWGRWSAVHLRTFCNRAVCTMLNCRSHCCCCTLCSIILN